MCFPGTWMTESESVVYRVVPKCACSTIGQIMYYSDHGVFFDGDIHDAVGGMHKWALDESQEPISLNVQNHSSYAFTCVRNRYTRIRLRIISTICRCTWAVKSSSVTSSCSNMISTIRRIRCRSARLILMKFMPNWATNSLPNR